MSRYRVIIEETTIIRHSREFNADSAQDARELAEAEDWRTFAHEDTDTNSEILEVIYVSDSEV